MDGQLTRIAVKAQSIAMNARRIPALFRRIVLAPWQVFRLVLPGVYAKITARISAGMDAPVAGV